MTVLLVFLLIPVGVSEADNGELMMEWWSERREVKNGSREKEKGAKIRTKSVPSR